MKWWYFINYKVYDFYDRNRDKNAESAATIHTVWLPMSNILSALFIFDTLFKTGVYFSIFSGIITMVALMIFNFTTVYMGGKYKRIFKDMEEWDFKEQKPAKYFYIYLFVSIISFLFTLVHALIKSNI